MIKKALIIVTFIVILTIAGVTVWFFFLAPGARGVAQEEERQGFFGFFPFGGNGGADSQRPALPEGSEGLVLPGEEAQSAVADLRQLTTVPVAGALATTTRDGLVVRYVERQTGNIYDVSPAGEKLERVTNTTVPAVREAFFDKSGTALLLRYLNGNDVIRTFSARIATPEEETGDDDFSFEVSADIGSGPQNVNTETGGDSERLVGNFIDDEISFVAPSPDKTGTFYLSPLGSGVVGTVAFFGGTDKDQIFDSLFTEWLPEWPEDDTIALTTKASAYAEGFLYFLDADGGPLRRIIGNIPGLTTLTNPNAEIIAYSASADDTFTFHTFDIVSRQSKELPLATLPEKCVWSSKRVSVVYCGIPSSATILKGPYPDVWYQGIVSFSDTLWRIDTETSAVNLLAVPETAARQAIDVINPFLDASETYLFFTNKSDSTLWSLKLR